jgi:HAD superfamily hydrolase (TIGR01662 family)
MSLEAVTIVVPTVGRSSLQVLLDSVRAAQGPPVAEVIVVDDRAAREPLHVVADRVRVVRSGGRGPAAARNRGWRSARTEWIAFLDDDVTVSPTWAQDLERDLCSLTAEVGGSQGRIDVPLPEGRRPTDWERATAGLSTARWITADMAYRRSALQAVGGFDERFQRAYREDADLALRVQRAGWTLVTGNRRTTHPVRPVSRWISLRTQAGNADDVLMARLHGRGWRAEAQAPRGRKSRHFAVTAAGLASVGLALGDRPKAAAVALAAWLVGSGELAAARVAPGPRDTAETVTMLATSIVIPPLAVWHTLRGVVRHRRVQQWSPQPDAVLFDRDGTLVVDVPYNGDPSLVLTMPGARTALDRLRSAGVRVGVVTNQSGIGRGLLTVDEVIAVNARIEQLLGPFDVWQVCPHDVHEGCSCRKPAPGMVYGACESLGVHPARTVLVGDIGSDLEAAHSAGATGILVPTAVTRREEVAAAPVAATDLSAAADLILAGAW